MRRAPEVGRWISIKAPDGYELEMHVSRPPGTLRHRLLPDGEWREGTVPVDPSLEEVIGPLIAVEGENWTAAVRSCLRTWTTKLK